MPGGRSGQHFASLLSRVRWNRGGSSGVPAPTTKSTTRKGSGRGCQTKRSLSGSSNGYVNRWVVLFLWAPPWRCPNPVLLLLTLRSHPLRLRPRPLSRPLRNCLSRLSRPLRLRPKPSFRPLRNRPGRLFRPLRLRPKQPFRPLRNRWNPLPNDFTRMISSRSPASVLRLRAACMPLASPRSRHWQRAHRQILHGIPDDRQSRSCGWAGSNVHATWRCPAPQNRNRCPKQRSVKTFVRRTIDPVCCHSAR